MKVDDEWSRPPPWSLEHSVCRNSERCTTAFDSPRRSVGQNKRPRGDTFLTPRFILPLFTFCGEVTFNLFFFSCNSVFKTFFSYQPFHAAACSLELFILLVLVLL